MTSEKLILASDVAMVLPPGEPNRCQILHRFFERVRVAWYSLPDPD
jgi:hypothetical protein